jgi:hypothetical protein
MLLEALSVRELGLTHLARELKRRQGAAKPRCTIAEPRWHRRMFGHAVVMVGPARLHSSTFKELFNWVGRGAACAGGSFRGYVSLEQPLDGRGHSGSGLAKEVFVELLRDVYQTPFARRDTMLRSFHLLGRNSKCFTQAIKHEARAICIAQIRRPTTRAIIPCIVVERGKLGNYRSTIDEGRE